MKLNLGNRIKRDSPDNTQERVHKFVIEHKAVSSLTIVFIVAAFWKLVPFGILDFIPQAARRITVMALLANLIAWPFARWTYRKIRTLPADIIYVVNPADRQKVRKAYYLKGKFMDRFDFKYGKPLSWTNKQGLKVYQVTALDQDKNVAYCPPMGDYTPNEIMAFENAYEAQQLKNDRERRIGAQLRMKSGQIKSQIIGAVSNAWIRDLNAIEFQEHIEKETDNLLPDEIEPDTDIDIGNLEDIEKAAERIDLENMKLPDKEERE